MAVGSRRGIERWIMHIYYLVSLSAAASLRTYANAVLPAWKIQHFFLLAGSRNIISDREMFGNVGLT